MDFSFKVEGLDRIHKATDEVKQNIAVELDKAAFASIQRVATEYKKSILAGGKTGRIYKRRTVTHQASAPGESPASDTGRLVNAIHVLPERAGSAIMRVATHYALKLEHGTLKMAARPAAVPAMEKSRAWIIERFAKAVRIAAAKSVR